MTAFAQSANLVLDFHKIQAEVKNPKSALERIEKIEKCDYKKIRQTAK